MRTDSSTALGGGHLMRCLALADRLRQTGAEVIFICRDLPGQLSRLAVDRGFGTSILPGEPGQSDWQSDAEQTLTTLSGRQPIDWLIVDHYGLDLRWERMLRSKVGRIMVIDDLADRPHDCELLLDQNLTDRPANRYDSLTPPHCRKLLGLKYAILRQEFHDLRPRASARDGRLRRILVSFGGGDITGETEKALAAIRLAGCDDIAVDVVIGGANRRRTEIETSARSMPHVRVHVQTTDMAGLMVSADLTLGGGGISTWERCLLGLPAIVVIQAENQRESIEAAVRQGVLWNMGWHQEVTADMMAGQIEYLCERPTIVRATAEKAWSLMAEAAQDNGRSVVAAIMERAYVAS
ncbi:MAG: UDP-2,4-diacetamido-2,4,6-trideoxy-beta-L-altropyranose hydrolase [candidate division Zixibacteria bacterium]|nr:UDP-2,4-diacetamido-2,4,6-trideoxy-beta-L-altropyranose hydrolase [candidate division Zixibacteria bacterium]